MSCIFCDIVADRAPATIVRAWSDALAIVPFDPVTTGHVLVLPRRHVLHAIDDPVVAAATMRRAAEIAPYPSNIITSIGKQATQSVFHLHLHIVPRAENDGLALPWYSGKRGRFAS